ncbi:hypothetical protein CW711_01305 [Candidatus Bathyarchaeota archaeon]|nr:MAG: hypothetical protein CW711_01305 [Candidatus Bathyarchaeota archaeon]
MKTRIIETQDRYLNLIRNTSSRLRKGYYFERLITEVLNSLNAPYRSNPIESFSLWLAYTNTGYDLIVFNKRIELKYNSPDTVVYKSYLDRDWISREASVMVVNNDNPVLRSKRLLRYLKNKGKRVLSLSDFIKWIRIKLRHRVTSINVYLNRIIKNNIAENIGKAMSHNVGSKISLLLGNLSSLDKPPWELLKCFINKFLKLSSVDHKEEIETISKVLRLYPLQLVLSFTSGPTLKISQ